MDTSKSSNMFPNIPEQEKAQPWFKCLKPIIDARLTRKNYENSPLLQILQQSDSAVRSWKTLKVLIECVLFSVTKAETMFSWVHAIKTDSSPDDVINDMLSEFRAIPYLLLQGFSDIEYIRKEGIDFKAIRNGCEIFIEVTYIRSTGSFAKFQECIRENVFELHAHKLTNRLQSKYQEKQKQHENHAVPLAKCFILIISDCQDFDPIWLEHDKIQNQHPIQYFVSSCETPTIVLGPHLNEYVPDFDPKNPAFANWKPLNPSEYILKSYGLIADEKNLIEIGLNAAKHFFDGYKSQQPL